MSRDEPSTQWLKHTGTQREWAEEGEWQREREGPGYVASYDERVALKIIINVNFFNLHTHMTGRH